jgi:very-short-patch-repair endonuclease
MAGMPRRVALPPEFLDRPFTYAEAKAAGLSQSRLRGPDLDAPFRGIRSARVNENAPVNPVHPVDSHTAARVRERERVLFRCNQYLPLMRPGQFFSHATAARLFGCPMTDDFGSEPLHVTALSPERAPRRRNVSGHEIDPSRASTTHRYRLPVSTAPATWLALAPLLSVDELVVLADHFILDPYLLDPYDPRPYATIEELQLALASTHGRGARAATSALLLVRQGAESRPETLLRLLLRRAGLPDPECNVQVHDDAGKLLGRVDLFYPQFRAIIEYDGDGHRVDRVTYENDIRRRERFVNAGFSPVHVLAKGLFSQQATTIERVKVALARGGWREGAETRPRTVTNGPKA